MDTPTLYRFRDPMAPPNAPALAVFFRLDPQKNEAVTKETGIATYDDVLFAVVAPMGMPKSNTTCEIERTLPDGTIKVNQANATKYAEQLKLYKEGVASESTGTPLRDLPGITPAMIANLKARGLHTVEMLADLQDAANQDFMGFYEWREKARTHVAIREKNAPFVKVESEMAELKDLNASLQRQLADLQAVVAASEKRRGPGRPPREQEAA